MIPIGFIEQHPLRSHVLRGNYFKDPTDRLLTLYLPPYYHENPHQSYPVIYLLPSHGNTGQAFLNWRAWGESMENRLDRLMSLPDDPPAIVVMADFWTRVGGSQFVNSIIGNYEDYLIQEVIPFVDTHYRTTNKRGLIGHSSGGYGALVQGMRHPELFSAVAAHAGDLYWEYACLPAIASLHQNLTRYGGIEKFLEEIDLIEPKNNTFWQTLMTVCWTMVHGTNHQNPLGFDLPFDPQTGALNEAVWQKWLTFDPIRMIDNPDYQAALRGMKLVYLSAGVYDEHQLQVGARVMSQKLNALDIPHIHEEQAISHSGAVVPYDRSLSLMMSALAD